MFCTRVELHHPKGSNNTNYKEEKMMSDQESMSWGELAELQTHALHVEKFNWCGCEDNEGNENPYNDCPKEAE